ncbi:MAG: A/G-specific adenine glycosylase [Opitutales bacterium]
MPDLPALHAALRAWYLAHQRPLPWRTAPSLYKTVVSEFMLQQTQVETVLPYFARWLEQFPDFATLAAAREETVLRAWEGLGYYRRARLLHALARELAPLPQPPRTPAAWLEFPGVGPYTAAAITSITFHAPAAVVDGNVVRVLSRLLGDSTLYPDGSAAVKTLTPAADALLDHAHPGDHNQAVMELGATVCTRRSPLCTVCPLVPWCIAAAGGDPESLPRLAPKKTEHIALTRLWIERHGRLLLHRKPGSSRRLAGLCELPEASALPGAHVEPQPLAVKRRTIVNHQFTESIHRATLPLRTPDSSVGFLWVRWSELPKLTLSGPHRRWIQELRAQSH